MDQQPRIDETMKLTIEVKLAEYNSLREEILVRLESHSEAFNYLLLAIGAAITAVLTAAAQKVDIGFILPALALLLPAVTIPLAFIFFDHEMVMDAIGSHLHCSLRPSLHRLLNTHDVLHSVWEFKHLPASTQRVHVRVMIGRWALFLSTTVLPILCLIAYTAFHWGWWRKFLVLLDRPDSTLALLLGVGFCVLDLILLSILASTMINALLRYRAGWASFERITDRR
jgi:hypothetical protein